MVTLELRNCLSSSKVTVCLMGKVGHEKKRCSKQQRRGAHFTSLTPPPPRKEGALDSAAPDPDMKLPGADGGGGGGGEQLMENERERMRGDRESAPAPTAAHARRATLPALTSEFGQHNLTTFTLFQGWGILYKTVVCCQLLSQKPVLVSVYSKWDPEVEVWNKQTLHAGTEL